MSSVAETDFDNVLKEISKQIPISKIDDLGKALGFKYTEIETFTGTLKMLREWREKQTNPDEKAALRKCLKDAGLNRLSNLPILMDGQQSGGQVTEHHHQGAASLSVNLPAASSAATGPDRIATTTELNKLASLLHGDFYTDLAVHLGLEPAEFDNVRRENPTLKDANFRMLLKWKAKESGGLVVELDKALNESGCGALSKQYKEN